MEQPERLAEASTVRNMLLPYITAAFFLRSALSVFDRLTDSRSGAKARARPGEIALSAAFHLSGTVASIEEPTLVGRG